MKNKILFILLIASKLVFAQEQSTPTFVTDSLDKYIENILKDWDIPGMAVGIVKDGKIIVEKGYGIKDINTKKPIDENTLFMIGSNTKAFTATALAMLENNKKLSLNDKVTKYIPNFKMYNSYLNNEVNLTDIISHRLGFETFQGDFMFFDSDLDFNGLVEKVSKLKPIYDFRTKWGYCNSGYAIAGECIKSVSGKSWGEFIKQNILNPAGMNSTKITVEQMRNAENACTAHSLKDFELTTIEYGGLDLLGAAASMSSSVKDMNKWTKLLLNNGKYGDKTIIPKKAINRTRQPISIIGKGRHPFNKNIFRLYGMGWELNDYENYEIISHTGAVHGFLSSVTLIPEINLGVVILTNTDQNWAYGLAKWEIVDAYLNLPYRNYNKVWNSAYLKQQKQNKKRVKEINDSIKMNITPEIPINEFAGKYTNSTYGTVELSVKDNMLIAKFENHSKLSATLKYIGNNRFACTYSSLSMGKAIFPFTINNKKVKSFILTVSPDLEFTSYTFLKN